MKKLNNLILIMTCSMLLASQINAVTPGSICLATQDKAALGSKINVGSLLTSIKTHGKSFLSGKIFLYSAIAACAIGFLGFMGYKSWQKKKEDERLKREKATEDLLSAMSSLYQNEQKDELLNSIKNAIDNGADVNAKNEHDQTPLHFACFNCNVDMVKLLLERGANVNAKNTRKDTPLHIACLYIAFECTNIDLVELLLDNGADIEAENIQNKMAHELTFNKKISELLNNAREYNKLDNNKDKINFIKEKKVALTGLMENKSDEENKEMLENQEGAFSSLLTLALNKAKKAKNKELADSIEDIKKEYPVKEREDSGKETN